MERLTTRYKYNEKNHISVDREKNGITCSNYCTNCGKADCDDIRAALFKLAEYEDFEEIFREKMTETACDFLSDKEEFGKWLDRNKWITRKCDEWVRAEEHGLLLRLPCKVKSSVYLICARYTKCSKYNEEFDEYSCQGCDEECDSHKEYYIHKNLSVNLEWIVRNINSFGKTVFLTREEAEEALRKMKESTDSY